MNEAVLQVPIVVGLLLTCLLGPAIAIAMLLLRKRWARQRRRSPLGIDLLRGPGHTLRDQIEEATNDLSSDIFVLMLFPLLIVAVFLAQAHVRGLQGMVPLLPIYVAAVLAVVAWVVRGLWRASSRLDNLRTGYDAEVAVGQELDQLMRQGAAVFHDFPADGFNIDHVVISRCGVFAVETKGFTKPGDQRGRAGATVTYNGEALSFPRRSTREPLEQAERQAAWLAKWLGNSTGEPVPVVPVLALPGWFVDRKGRGPVRVYSGKELAGLLDAKGVAGPSEEAIRRISHQVEQRCRTVAPRYGGRSTDTR